MARDPKKLTEKERAFVLAYTGIARGNGTQAAILAGYTSNRPAAAVQASVLLKRPSVAAALRKLHAAAERKAERARLSHAERDAILEEIALDKNAYSKDRRGAIAELNRVDGRHSVKHVHEVGASLAEILAKSWEADEA